MHDEFGHHRVVERADAVAFTHTIVNANRTTLVVMRCHFETGAIRFAIPAKHLLPVKVVVQGSQRISALRCMAMYTIGLVAKAWLATGNS